MTDAVGRRLVISGMHQIDNGTGTGTGTGVGRRVISWGAHKMLQMLQTLLDMSYHTGRPACIASGRL